MSRDGVPSFNRERSFSAPAAEMDLPAPPFSVPPVVLPSGCYTCSPSCAPSLSDMEQKLLRGMTVSLAMDRNDADDATGWRETAPFVDCDCWLGHDKNDGFILCVWNLSSGELREICLMFVTDINLVESAGSTPTLILSCPIGDSLLPPPPGNVSEHIKSDPITIRFLLRMSTTPTAEKFSIFELHTVLEEARNSLSVNDNSASPSDSRVSGDNSSNTKQKKRTSVHSTASKRVSILHTGRKGSSGNRSSMDSLNTARNREGSLEAFPGVTSLIEKFSIANEEDSNDSKSLARRGMMTKAKCGSVANLFDGVEELLEEEDEDDDQQ